MSDLIIWAVVTGPCALFDWYVIPRFEPSAITTGLIVQCLAVVFCAAGYLFGGAHSYNLITSAVLAGFFVRARRIALDREAAKR